MCVYIFYIVTTRALMYRDHSVNDEWNRPMNVSVHSPRDLRTPRIALEIPDDARAHTKSLRGRRRFPVRCCSRLIPVPQRYPFCRRRDGHWLLRFNRTIAKFQNSRVRRHTLRFETRNGPWGREKMNSLNFSYPTAIKVDLFETVVFTQRLVCCNCLPELSIRFMCGARRLYYYVCRVLCVMRPTTTTAL